MVAEEIQLSNCDASFLVDYLFNDMGIGFHHFGNFYTLNLFTIESIKVR